jgi:hypothetical protein
MEASSMAASSDTSSFCSWGELLIKGTATAWSDCGFAQSWTDVSGA